MRITVRVHTAYLGICAQGTRASRFSLPFLRLSIAIGNLHVQMDEVPDPVASVREQQRTGSCSQPLRFFAAQFDLQSAEAVASRQSARSFQVFRGILYRGNQKWCVYFCADRLIPLLSISSKEKTSATESAGRAASVAASSAASCLFFLGTKAVQSGSLVQSA